MVRLDEAGRLALHLPIAPCVKVTEAVTKSTPGVFFPVFCTLCSSHPFAAHSSLVVAFARRRRWAPPGSFFCTLVPCYPVFVVSLFASTTEGEQTTAQKKGPSQTDVLKTLVSLSATSAAAAATVVNCRPPLGPEETQTSEDVVYNPSHHCLHL